MFARDFAYQRAYQRKTHGKRRGKSVIIMRRRFDRRREEPRGPPVNWQPMTSLGQQVKNKEIVSIDDILSMGKGILETEIVDTLLPNLVDETMEVCTTQRMTDSGRKYKYRVIMLVGDKNGHFGIGVGKSEEVKPAMETAIREAKKNLVSIPLGCGSWECTCGLKHTLPLTIAGEYGGIELVLKPAPKGIGICANKVVRKVLIMAGVKDIWSFSRGRTSNVYNMSMAVVNAAKQIRYMKGAAYEVVTGSGQVAQQQPPVAEEAPEA